MSDYTPTTDEAFDATLYTWLDWQGTFENESDARAAWDRMIAAVERAAAERAWDRCVGEMPIDLDWKNFYADNNPYRAAALGLTAGQEGETVGES